MRRGLGLTVHSFGYKDGISQPAIKGVDDVDGKKPLPGQTLVDMGYGSSLIFFLEIIDRSQRCLAGSGQRCQPQPRSMGKGWQLFSFPQTAAVRPRIRSVSSPGLKNMNATDPEQVPGGKRQTHRG